MLAFVVWILIGAAFIGLGVYAFSSKKETAFGFWANAKTFPVDDVKSYNKAMGKLWIIFGIVFILFEIPLLAGQNSPYVLISILGVAFESIIVMVIYTITIEGKYRKKER